MSTHLLARLLHRDPPIVLGPGLTHIPLGPAGLTAPLIGARPAWTLVVVHWSLEGAGAIRTAAAAWHAHRAAWPRHAVTFLCNTAAEQALLAAAGVDAVLCNHGVYVDEQIFTIDPGAPRDYDAVYNARLDPYKRHELCRAIDRLALLYHELERSDPAHVAAIKALLPKADFVNERLARSGYARTLHPRAAALVNAALARRGYTKLTLDTIVAILNRAGVGLCLSAVEGAMYAGTEYLLCGLPVVTTPSRGGRDYFFAPDYALTVAADPAAIRDGVNAMNARALPRAAVRAAVLARVQRERARLVDLLHAVFRAAGVESAATAAIGGLFRGRPWAMEPVAALAGLRPGPDGSPADGAARQGARSTATAIPPVRR